MTDTRRHDTNFPVEDHSTSVIITEAVAAVKGVKTTTLPCLEHVVAADELDTLIESNREVEVHFPYEEYQITIRGNGSLTIQELE